MTVVTANIEVTKPIYYWGLSTNTKPTPQSSFITGNDGLYINAYYTETDTSDVYQFDGVQWVLIKHAGALLISNPMMDIAEGLIPSRDSINKFGTNINIADGVEEIVWSPSHAYTFSTTADISDVVSSNAGDTGTVEVQGLDTNWDEVIQTKTLTGTTSVALDTALIRVFRMRYNDAATNAGNIQCGVGSTTTSFSAANLRAQVDIGLGQTLMAIYTIPAGKSGYFQKYYGSMVGDPGPPAREPSYGIFRIYSADRANGYAAQLKHVIGAAIGGSSVIEHDFNPPVSVGEKTDIYITAEPRGDVGSFSAGFDLVIVDD